MSTFGLWQKRNKQGNLYLYGKCKDEKIMVVYKNYFRTTQKQPHYKIKFVELSQIKSTELKEEIENWDLNKEFYDGE